jgi:hypothetical protein
MNGMIINVTIITFWQMSSALAPYNGIILPWSTVDFNSNISLFVVSIIRQNIYSYNNNNIHKYLLWICMVLCRYVISLLTMELTELQSVLYDLIDVA